MSIPEEMQKRLFRLVDILSAPDLRNLRDIIDKKLAQLSETEDIEEIKQGVENDGYYLTTDEYNIEDLGKMKLLYYIDVWTWDKEDKEDTHVDGSSDKQEPWVKELNFSYKPSDKDVYELSDDWEYGDWDEPIRGKAIMHIYLYYKPQQVPPNGTKFRTIVEEDGIIETWEVKDDKVYHNGHCIDHRENMNQLFILPEEK